MFHTSIGLHSPSGALEQNGHLQKGSTTFSAPRGLKLCTPKLSKLSTSETMGRNPELNVA